MMALVDTRVLDHTGTRSAGVAAGRPLDGHRVHEPRPCGQRNGDWMGKRLLTEEEEQATVRSNVLQFGRK